MNKLLPIAFIVFAVIGCKLPSASSSAVTPKPPPPAAHPSQIRLLSAKVTRRLSYMTVTGQIENISPGPIEPWVVIEQYDKDGILVNTDEAITKTRPVQPGQRAAFEVISDFQKSMKTYTIKFRTDDRGEINYDDARPN